MIAGSALLVLGPAREDEIVRIGIIGCGRASETRHLPALRRVRGGLVVAVADVDATRLGRVADAFRIERRHDDARALLADPELDAVAVCVPARAHAEVALAALEAGKHVLVEKPLAVSAAQAERLAEGARTFSSKVVMGFNMRWHRLVRQAREVIASGRLGPIESMRTAFTSRHLTVPEWRARRELGGGVLFEIAVHHFDLWRFLLGTEVDEVVAVSRSGEWDDETVTVMARLANGIPVTSVFSERTGETNEIEIYGRNGRLRVSCYDYDGFEVVAAEAFPGDARERGRRLVRAVAELPGGVARMRHGGDFLMSYEAEWQHFLDAIQHDRPVECSVEDGRRALDVALAAMASASLGRAVKVADAPRGVTPVVRAQA